MGLGKDESRLRSIEGTAATFSISFAYLRALVLLVISFALYHAWAEIFFIGVMLPLPESPYDTHQLFILFRAVAFFSGVILARRIKSIAEIRISYVLIAVVLLVSTVCMLVGVSVPHAADPLFLVGSASGGIGIGFVMLLWFESANYLSPILILLCYLASVIFAPSAIVVLYDLPVVGIAVVSVMLPVAMVLALALAFGPLESRLFAGDRPVAYSSLWRIVVLMAVFGFAMAMREPLMENGMFSSASYTAFGSLGISMIVLLGTVMKGRAFDFIYMLRVLLPLTAVAFLLLPIDMPFVGTVSDTCSSAADELAKILAIFAIASYCRHKGIPVLGMYSLAYGVHSVFVFLGRESWAILDYFGMSSGAEAMYLSLVSAVVIAVTILLLPTRDSFAQWGVGQNEGTDDLEAGLLASDTKVVADRCRTFSKEHGLTAREEEVLNLLMQGKTLKEIEEQLVIAKETAKTHRRNILVKCDVRTVDDLKSQVFSPSR